MEKTPEARPGVQREFMEFMVSPQRYDFFLRKSIEDGVE